MQVKTLAQSGCDTSFELIQDIMVQWGEKLEYMHSGDAWFLIARISSKNWFDNTANQPPSEEAEEVADRIYELPYGQQIALLKCIANSSPLIVNGDQPQDLNEQCDFGFQLIQDIAQTWGTELERISEIDAHWLVSKISHEIWVSTDVDDEPESDEAAEVIGRVYDLPYEQRVALVRAIANT